MVVVEDHIDRVEIGGARVVAAQNASRKRALQRGELEDGVMVLPQDELGEAVAESADAVVEKDGAGHGVRAG